MTSPGVSQTLHVGTDCHVSVSYMAAIIPSNYA